MLERPNLKETNVARQTSGKNHCPAGVIPEIHDSQYPRQQKYQMEHQINDDVGMLFNSTEHT
jgi:hypothetical protein